MVRFAEAAEALGVGTAFGAELSLDLAAPPNGVADPALFGLDRAPVELVRQGGAVCIVNYQSAAQSGQAPQGDPAQPLSVSCQSTVGGDTVQVGSQGMTVAATVALLDRVGAALA